MGSNRSGRGTASAFLFLGVVVDVTLRQRLLKFLDRGLGEVGVIVEVKYFQLRESCQGTDIGEQVVFEEKVLAK